MKGKKGGGGGLGKKSAQGANYAKILWLKGSTARPWRSTPKEERRPGRQLNLLWTYSTKTRKKKQNNQAKTRTKKKKNQTKKTTKKKKKKKKKKPQPQKKAPQENQKKKKVKKKKQTRAGVIILWRRGSREIAQISCRKSYSSRKNARSGSRRVQFFIF